jgi:hypothetical protein
VSSSKNSIRKSGLVAHLQDFVGNLAEDLIKDGSNDCYYIKNGRIAQSLRRYSSDMKILGPISQTESVDVFSKKARHLSTTFRDFDSEYTNLVYIPFKKYHALCLVNNIGDVRILITS